MSDPQGEFAESRVRGGRAPSARSATLPAGDAMAAADAHGGELVRLVAHRGDPDAVLAVSRKLQPHVLAITRARLDADALPLPELLVAGDTVHRTVLSLVERPTERFSARFLAELEIAIEYFRLRRLFVDRWLLQEMGLDVRSQARVAAIVEETLRLPLRERRLVHRWLGTGERVEAIGADLGMTEAESRGILARVVRAARPSVADWVSHWEPPSTKRRKRRRRTKRG